MDGKVLLYADQVTGSMERAIAEQSRLRKQLEYNARHGITPERKVTIADILDSVYEKDLSVPTFRFAEDAGHWSAHSAPMSSIWRKRRMRRPISLEEAGFATIRRRGSGACDWRHPLWRETAAAQEARGYFRKNSLTK